MIFGSTFSGIGGLDKGFSDAGWDCAFQVEINKYRRSILKKHFPEVPRYEDIKEFPAGPAASIDALIGGFPCQGLSTAGLRKGLDDERSGLFWEFVRIAGLLQPPWIVLENVPGLLSSSGGRDFAIVLNALSDLGYGVAWRVVDSRFFGVAQRRKRVFIVGRAGGLVGRAGAVLFESEGGGRDLEASKQSGEGLARPLEASSGRPSWKGEDHETYIPEIAYALAARNSKGISKLEGQNNLVAYSLEAADGHHGHSSPRGDGTDNLVADGGVRRLTPTECERLQGFPDGWTLPGADGPRYSALGDAVTVPVAHWLASRLMVAHAM